MADSRRSSPGFAAQSRGAWAEVDLGAVRGNLDYARAVVPRPVMFMAVVKADAYGHGMIEIAHTALAWGCEWLGVGNLAEGLALRAAGINAPCLVLAPPITGDEPTYVSADLIPSIDSQFGAAALAAAVRSAGAPPRPIHLLVDTGIGRYGVAPAELPALGAAVASMPELRLAGVYTHFAEPGDPASARREFAAFQQAVGALVKSVGPVPLLHAAGSEAALLVPEARLQMVRLGNLLYGYWAGTRAQLPPALGGGQLRTALTICCRIAALRDVERGQSLGYGGFRAPHRMRVAVLPIGFADGVGLRAVQAGAGSAAVLTTMAKEVAKAALPAYRPSATILGQNAPFVGKVGMQFTLVDVTAIPAAEPGMVAELPGIRATAAAQLPRVYLR